MAERSFTDEELKEILEKHKMWLNNHRTGACADLSNADLSWADLRDADLRKANLDNACLLNAYLRNADLSGASLENVNLGNAELINANLRRTDLRHAYCANADMRNADIRKADMSIACLAFADLRGATLRRANLKDATLRNADLRNAALTDADLENAVLTDANLKGAYLNYPISCPEEGSFIGFKKCKNYIVKLQVTEDSLRSSSTSRKCRCSKVKVLSITNLDGTNSGLTEVQSDFDPCFVYAIGETIEVYNFDTNRWNACAPGIHFFITRQEAVDY